MTNKNNITEYASKPYVKDALGDKADILEFQNIKIY